MSRTWSVVMIAAAAVACVSTPPREQTAAEMYGEAVGEANPSSSVGKAFRDCKIAAGKFRKVIQNYPGTDYAALALIGMADCSFDDERWDEAVSPYRQFVDRYTTHREYPKALFRLAECYYHQHDDYDLEMVNLRNAMTYYSMFMGQFASHPLASDAGERYAEVRGQLAEHELYVAKHYLREESYGPAYERLGRLIKAYPETTQAETAKTLRDAVAAKVGLDGAKTP